MATAAMLKTLFRILEFIRSRSRARHRGCWLDDEQQMRLRRRGTDGLSTHRWSEGDSNRRSHLPTESHFSEVKKRSRRSIGIIPKRPIAFRDRWFESGSLQRRVTQTLAASLAG